ncbi:MAG: dihydropyrimidinase [Anaerolineaceae bacterium]
MKKIIFGGTIVTSSEIYPADILIEDEKIQLISKDLPINPNIETIDATGMYVLPGGVDVHTHFDLPMFGTVSSDDHYSGHKAAAFGGTTTVIDFVPQNSESLIKDIDFWHKKADENAAIDFGFHMNITKFTSQISDEIPSLINEGITSLKVFTAYNNTLRLDDRNIFQVMRIAAEFGFLTLLHAENGDIIEILVEEAIAKGNKSPIWHARTRPSWGAVEAVVRGVSFAAQTGAPLYIVHMNAAGEVDQLQYARDHHIKVMGETCPQYLFFNESFLEREDGPKWICSPPMRSISDNIRLWEGLSEGIIQVLATDHCPFFFDGTHSIEYEGKQVRIPGKELGRSDFRLIPNGLPAVGDRLPILWTEGVVKRKLTLNQFVAITSTNPAKIFGMYPQKGTILPGSDADLVIWDPNKKLVYGRKVAQHRTDYNLFEDWNLSGFPIKVFLRGNLIVDGLQWNGSRGQGRYLKRSPNAYIL